MTEVELGSLTPPADAARFARLESRIAALERLLAASAETTEFKLRNLKREIGTVSRSVVQRGNRES